MAAVIELKSNKMRQKPQNQTVSQQEKFAHKLLEQG
jgi:hypothetical protein